MLEKPAFSDEKISACLQAEFALGIVELSFLPLGADANTAVYRALDAAGEAYFVKLRRGAFDPLTVDLPAHLHANGEAAIIAPLTAASGQHWVRLEPFALVVYPFIEGQDGYEQALTAEQWCAFGAAVRRLHSSALPPDLAQRLPRETYSPRFRRQVLAFQARAARGSLAHPAARELADFMQAQRAQIRALVDDAAALAQSLQARPAHFVPCHTDLHPGNLLLTANGGLYIVDWDNPLLALPERDLMFIGGGQGFRGVTPAEEEDRFYRGYGRGYRPDPLALTYYRLERIVQDIAAFCEEIFDSGLGDADLQRSLDFFKSNFQPGGTIEVACRV